MKRQTGTRAFSLTEVVIALGICGFCLLAMLGLLSAGLNNNRDTVSKTEAASIAKMVVSDLFAMTNGVASPQFEINPPTGGSFSHSQTLYFGESGSNRDADGGVIAPDASRYRVDIAFGEREDPDAPSPVYVLVSWPGAASEGDSWPTKHNGSYEVVTTLNP